MCADGAKEPASRFAYRNAFHGLIRIGREEGLKAFTKGLGPNVVRSVLMSVFPPLHCSCLFADSDKMCHRLQCKRGFPFKAQCMSPNNCRSYTSAKRKILASSWLGLKDGVPVHILASLTAGTVATTVCAPADVLKSRFQSAGAGKSQVRIQLPLLPANTLTC